MPRDYSIKKVLVIGSGPIVIGQAAEFDYAGAQACRVLKAEGVNVVLVNSNPATIMTDKEMADEIYLEPLTEETLKRIIEKEKPDSVLAGLGGQTGLTLAMQLSRSGFLKRAGVRLIGSNTEAIDKAEDRELFKKTMQEIGEPVIPSDIAHTVEEALCAAGKIGYPVIKVHCSESAPADKDGECRTLRDWLWWKSRKFFRSRPVHFDGLPEDPVWKQMKMELLAPTYKIASGKVVAESKDDMKKRGLRSPNLADALNTTFFQDYEIFQETYSKLENLSGNQKKCRKKIPRSWKTR